MREGLGCSLSPPSLGKVVMTLAEARRRNLNNKRLMGEGEGRGEKRTEAKAVH